MPNYSSSSRHLQHPAVHMSKARQRNLEVIVNGRINASGNLVPEAKHPRRSCLKSQAFPEHGNGQQFQLRAFFLAHFILPAFTKHHILPISFPFALLFPLISRSLYTLTVTLEGVNCLCANTKALSFLFIFFYKRRIVPPQKREPCSCHCDCASLQASPPYTLL